MIIGGFDIASYKSGVFFLDLNSLKFKSLLIDIKNPNAYERIREFNSITKDLLEKYEPDILVIESTYLDEWRKHKNTKKRGNINTLKILEKFHGVLLSNTSSYMDIAYMSPNEHKEALTGIGNATKQSTIWAVQKKLGIAKMGSDEADAAALVLTYLMKRKRWDILEKLQKNGMA